MYQQQPDIMKKKLSEVTVEELVKVLENKYLHGMRNGIINLEKWTDNVSGFIEQIYKDVQQIKRG